MNQCHIKYSETLKWTIKDKQIFTYCLAPMLDLVEAASSDPHDISSHYRDSHLCIMASDTNEKKTWVGTHVQLTHLLLYTVVTPSNALWVLVGPHPRSVYEDEV